MTQKTGIDCDFSPPPPFPFFFNFFIILSNLVLTITEMTDLEVV